MQAYIIYPLCAGQRRDRAANAGPHAALYCACAHARAGKPGGARVCRLRAHTRRRLLLWRCGAWAPYLPYSTQTLNFKPYPTLANQVEREFAASAPTLAVGCFYGGAGRGRLRQGLGRGAVLAASVAGRGLGTCVLR